MEYLLQKQQFNAVSVYERCSENEHEGKGTLQKFFNLYHKTRHHISEESSA
jgi:hypothetical protein